MIDPPIGKRKKNNESVVMVVEKYPYELEDERITVHVIQVVEEFDIRLLFYKRLHS